MKPKISLCVIAGNVESIIGRFLDAFQNVADEIVVVRARGCGEVDATMAIAQERGAKIGFYENRLGNYWDHVDDFAAARNMACDIATGDWLMWADTDDLIDADSIQQIRLLIDDIHGKDCDGVLIPYVVPEDGVINWRERLWRKGSARWQNPIHECLKFNDDARPSIRFESARITHASEPRTAARDERNLRILESIPEGERTVSQKFHVFQSLIALDRNAEAIPKAIEFVGLEGVAKPELYEAYFQLARLAENADIRKAMLIQAIATDPCRREAFGELGLASLPADPESALGWTEAMMALKMPANPPWNLRRTYYGQLGVGLRGMALRAADRREEADALESCHFIRAGAKISLLHATRGRPAMAWKTRMEWMRSADNPDAVEHIFAIDSDDPESFPLLNTRSVFVPQSGGSVAAWNAAAEQSQGQVMVQLSDDFRCSQGWDTAILTAIGDTSKAAVLAVSDGGRNDDLLCMAILTRKRYQDQGFLFHPAFFSVYSDNWFTDCAYRDGAVIDAKHLLFEHVHPAFGKAASDPTYERGNSNEAYAQGAAIFNRLKSGIKLAGEIEGWCDYSGFYRALARSIPEGGSFVEIGSWMGQSISYLCQELQDIEKTAKVWCVDTFKGEQNQPAHVEIVEDHGGSVKHIFERNTQAAGVRNMLEIIVGDSAESASQFDDGSLDGVFIDAAHDYDSVVKDLAAWYPKVKPDGIFSGHDYPCEDVKRAVTEHAAANGYRVSAFGRCWIKMEKLAYKKTALCILAHESAQSTVDLFLPQWKQLDCDLYCSIPEGDKINGFDKVLTIGKSAYSGKDVFHRFTATLGVMIETGADRIVIAEYDTVNLRPDFPSMIPGTVISCFVTDGDQVCALSPWAMDLAAAKQLHSACLSALEDGDYPEGKGLLDRWIGNVIRRAEIKGHGSSDCIGYPWKPGTVERIKAEGINWIHGWKTKEEFGGLLP